MSGDDLDKPRWRDPFWLVLIGYALILFVLMLLLAWAA